ncbi:MAG: type II toxin-antitoxin system RelE family toxin [Candidatus Muiribacteriaceae bacterium]
MVYKLIFSADAINDLKKIDKKHSSKIIKKCKTFLVKDPFHYGKPLKGVFRGLYRYRVDNFRVIYTIKRSEIIVAVLKVGHRKQVYK